MARAMARPMARLAGLTHTERVRQIGPYLIEGSLGKGAMGEVLLALHPALGQRYALKLLPWALVEDEDSFQRFEREVEALGRVDGHPGIVRVHSAGRTEEGQPYYVMELVSGRTLREALKEGQPLERTLGVLEAVAEALDHAHRHGVIHRDVKPANVLLGDDGVVRLTDFGLARDAEAQAERLTRTGDMVGTPAYMAPEQASPKLGAVGPWSDVWGVGAVLYEALVGHVPYPGETSVEIYGKLVDGTPIPAPRQLKAVPPALDALCVRCLQRDPGRRYQSAGELAQALRRLREGEPEAPPVATTTLLAVVAGLSLLLAALAVGALLWQARARAAARAEAEGLLQARSAELAAIRGLADPVAQAEQAGLLLARREARTEAADPRLRELFHAAQALRDEALRRSVEAAWEAGDGRLALERLMQAGQVEVPVRPWVLAAGGQWASALAALPPGSPEAARARLAALAGDREACAAALERLAGQGEPAQARALSRRLAACLPGLPAAGLSEGEKGWAVLARAEEALSQGDPALAALELAEERGAEEPAPGVRAAGALLGARLALARGDLAAAAGCVERAWSARGQDPLLALECVVWAGLLAPQAPELRLQGLGSDLAGEVRRRVPGDAGAWVVAGGFDQVRRAIAAGDRARARSACEALGLEEEAARSLVLAELALARRGGDGAAGLLLARAAELADRALLGGDVEAAKVAAELAGQAVALRPRSPAALLTRARALRAARLPALAREPLELARQALPDDPLVRLELARVALGELEEERLSADLLRAAERADEEDEAATAERRRREGALAARLEAVGQAFVAARQAAPAGDELEEQARLEGAAAQLERAWRLGRAGADEARQEARRAAREELLPLLAQVPRQALSDARWGLIQALTEAPEQDGGERLDRAERVRGAERGLAAAARGVSPRARAATALAAATAADDDDARAWAALWLTLAGDLPARAVLALRRGEAASGAPARRQAELAHALELLPELPRALLAQEGLRLDPQGESPKPGLAAGSALALARAALDPDELDHARALLALATRGEDLPRALELLEQDAARADAALVGLARALLLLEVGGGEDASAARRAERARQAARAAGASLRLRSTPAGHLLRARALARLGAVVLPDARYHLRCARAEAPWVGACDLLELELPPAAPEDQAEAVDRLLAAGFLRNPAPVRAQVRPGVVAQRLDVIAGAVGGLSVGQPRTAFAWAKELQGGGLRRAGLLLRLRTGVEVWNAFDGEERQSEAALEALEALPGARACARAAWHLSRGLKVQYSGHEREGREELRRGEYRAAAAEASRAALLAAACGAPGLPDPVRLDARGAPCEGELALEREARLRAHPAEEGMRDWWCRIQRAEQALVLRARAWSGLGGDGGASLRAADLADPWGLAGAVLRSAQDGDHWPIEALLAGEELTEARLAVERDAAFSRTEAPGDAYYWRLLWSVRWASARDLEGRVARRRVALEALRTPQVAGTLPEALRALHADVALDLAFAAPAGSPERRDLLEEAQQLLEELPRGEVQYDGSRAVGEWRRLRAALLGGRAERAEELLGRLRERVQKDQDGGLRDALEHELEPARAEMEAALPGLREVIEAALRWD